MLRVGFCKRLNQQSVRLGEDKYSWALCSSGQKASEGNFESFVELPDLKVGDVFSSLLDLDRCPAELRFAHNGKDLGVAFEVQLATEKPVATSSEAQKPVASSSDDAEEPVVASSDDAEKPVAVTPDDAEKLVAAVSDDGEKLPASSSDEAGKPHDTDEVEERKTETTDKHKKQSTPESDEVCKNLAFYPAVLTKNVKVEVNFGQIEESLPLESGETEYVFPCKTEESDRVKDDIAPYTKRECELIMMIGLPSSGKSTWVRQQLEKHPEKHYNVLGTASVLSRMKFEGDAETKTFSEELVKKAMSCLTKLIETAAKQRR